MYCAVLGHNTITADTSLDQWFSTCRLWSLSQRSPKAIGKQVFILQLITIVKLHVWSSDKGNFMVGGHHRKSENHWSGLCLLLFLLLGHNSFHVFCIFFFLLWVPNTIFNFTNNFFLVSSIFLYLLSSRTLSIANVFKSLFSLIFLLLFHMCNFFPHVCKYLS